MAEHEILGILGLLGFFLKCEVKLWNLDNTDAPSCHTGKVLIKSSKQQCCDSAKMGKLVWWIKSTQKIKHKSGNVCRSKKPFINIMHPTFNGIGCRCKTLPSGSGQPLNIHGEFEKKKIYNNIRDIFFNSVISFFPGGWTRREPYQDCSWQSRHS